MVASTVCSASGLIGTYASAEVVIEETAACDDVDVVIERAKEADSDFWRR